jgi:pimeloyl-ACP methyl ester carboxylesterase
MYYQKTGEGDAIVLIHGFPENGNLWNNITGHLALTNTLIIPDLPGSGQTKLDGSVSLAEMASRLKDLLTGEAINKCVVAGHSLGGYVALAFAAMYPEMVAGLCLVHSTPVTDDEEKKQIRKKSIELIRKGGKRGFLRQMVSGLFSPAFMKARPELVERQIAAAMEIEEEGLINFYEAMMHRPDRTNVLQQPAFPVQWILGADDNVIPLQNILPYCHKADINFVSFYENCGHMSMIEMPVELKRDIKAFTDYCYSVK